MTSNEKRVTVSVYVYGDGTRRLHTTPPTAVDDPPSSWPYPIAHCARASEQRVV